MTAYFPGVECKIYATLPIHLFDLVAPLVRYSKYFLNSLKQREVMIKNM